MSDVDKAGMIESPDGRLERFDDWFWRRYNEPPSLENIAKRIAKLLEQAVFIEDLSRDD